MARALIFQWSMENFSGFPWYCITSTGDCFKVPVFAPVRCRTSIRSHSLMYSYHFHVTSVLYLRSLVLATSFHAQPSRPLNRVLFFFFRFLFSSLTQSSFSFLHLRLCERGRHFSPNRIRAWKGLL